MDSRFRWQADGWSEGEAPMIRFGPYRLDPVQGLKRGQRDVRLTPRSLAVLVMLAGQPGRVVTKEELFSTVWRESAVTDAALATCIQEIRRALGDQSRSPRFIETVHRRGYRFVARTLDDAPLVPAEEVRLPAPTVLVGRQREVAALIDAFDRARRRSRQLCLISGEAGVGKSAVLAEALARMAERDVVAVTWANCVEQYGRGEPYQPLLDAIMRLCRGPAGDRTIATLERYAPMWLAQLPGLLAPHEAATLQQRLVGAVRDRMLRELTNAVEAMARTETLVLAIEDLHWSDPSTLDWISNVAPRMDPARLLVIATLRPTSGGEADGQLMMLRESIHARRQATEIALPGLAKEAVEEYVIRTLAPAPGRELAFQQLAERVHHHTGGNPLFMATMLDQLVERGVVTSGADGWDTSPGVEDTDLGIPDSIRPVIDRQIARLSPVERRVLEAASAAGDSFDLDVVATAAELDEDAAETTLLQPASRRFVRPSAAAPTHDRRSPQFEFVHTLFRDALYGGIARTRRAALHLRIAEFEEQTSETRGGEIAAELALHFELGGDDSRAIDHLRRAGDSARRRSAFREARRHYEHALVLLARQPSGSEDAARELDLQIGLGAATMATAGFGAPPVEAAYSRARELSQQIGDSPGQFPALFGLWLFYWGRGEVRTADGLARDMRRRARRDPDLRLQAAHASWTTAFSLGAFNETLRHYRSAMRLYERDRHAGMAATYGSHDAAVCSAMFAGRASAIMGRADESARIGQEAVTLARSLEHPFSLGLALTFRAASAQALGDLDSATENVEEATTIAREQGFRLMLGWCLAVSGWVAVQRGDADLGGARIDEAIATTRATGSDQFVSYFMASRAEAYLAASQPGEALRAARDGLAAVAKTGERFYEAELHRLEGEALAAADGDTLAASTALRRGVDVAAQQGAGLFALRSAIRLARMASDADHARDLLAVTRGTLPADSDLPEALQADSLLATAQS
jgi:DNA-binding winged helix-turn-helix (wHTH) protein/tetratricopeptide (TPR) repeat protein